MVRFQSRPTYANSLNTSRAIKILKLKKIRKTRLASGFFDLGLGDILDFGLGIAGGVQQGNVNDQNQANFQQNLAFQRESAQKAHQWETKDLEKAGLNRILGYSKGSGGASPGGGSALPNLANKVTSALQAKNLSAQTRAINAEAVLKENQAGAVPSQIEKTKAETSFTISNERLKQFEIEFKALSTEQLRNQLLHIQPETINQAKIKTVDMRLAQAIQQIKKGSDKEKLIQLKTRLTEAKSKEAYWKILGENAHLLKTAATIAGVGLSIAGIWAALTKSVVKKIPMQKNPFNKGFHKRGNTFP